MKNKIIALTSDELNDICLCLGEVESQLKQSEYQPFLIGIDGVEIKNPISKTKWTSDKRALTKRIKFINIKLKNI
jgi:hypothetical protein